MKKHLIQFVILRTLLLRPKDLGELREGSRSVRPDKGAISSLPY
ncbi:MAG TPA: hypothetical protein VLX60_16035 [Terriglobales bacterium]|nr:hypothetical protein [Terriglobales bacterium]